MPTRLAQHLLVAFVVVTEVTCYWEPVVVPEIVRMGRPFTVFCDASRMGHLVLFPKLNIISDLRISKGLGNETIYVASLQCAAPNQVAGSFSKIPPGRSWDITYSGNNIAFAYSTKNYTANGFNWDTMRISLKMYDAKLEDTGVYWCRVEFLTYFQDKYQLIKENSGIRFKVYE